MKKTSLQKNVLRYKRVKYTKKTSTIFKRLNELEIRHRSKSKKYVPFLTQIDVSHFTTSGRTMLLAFGEFNLSMFFHGYGYYETFSPYLSNSTNIPCTIFYIKVPLNLFHLHSANIQIFQDYVDNKRLFTGRCLQKMST